MKDQFYKTLIHFYPKFSNYWDSSTHCNLTERPSTLGKYYLDFSSKVPYPYKIDSNGVPLFFFQNKYIYHPTVICQYAIGLFEHITSTSNGRESLTKDFLNQTNWLANNYVKSNNAAFWYLKYNMSEYKLNAPWSSGIVQGEAISVLLRTSLITKNESYLKLANSALNSFLVDIKDNGFSRLFQDENLLFEEYPSKKNNFSLNGFIFSLFGLYDFYLYNKNPIAEELFWKGINTLKKSLPKFDLGYWSKYSLFFDRIEYPSSNKYHLLHIEMLKSLYIITSENIFLETSIKWQKYHSNFFNKNKSLIKKIIAIKKLNEITD